MSDTTQTPASEILARFRIILDAVHLDNEDRHLSPLERHRLLAALDDITAEARAHLAESARLDSAPTLSQFETARNRVIELATRSVTSDATDPARQQMVDEIAGLEQTMYAYDTTHPRAPGEARRLSAMEEFDVACERAATVITVLGTARTTTAPALTTVQQRSALDPMPMHVSVETENGSIEVQRQRRVRKEEERELYEIMRRAYTLAFVREYPMPSVDVEEEEEEEEGT